MDETDTESERWRFSRYAPPLNAAEQQTLVAGLCKELRELREQLAAEREKVQTLANALTRIRSVALKTDWELVKQIDTAFAKAGK